MRQLLDGGGGGRRQARVGVGGAYGGEIDSEQCRIHDTTIKFRRMLLFFNIKIIQNGVHSIKVLN